MNDLAVWHKNNDEYLSAAIGRLRARLIRLAEQHQVPEETSPSSPPSPKKQSFWSWNRDERNEMDSVPIEQETSARVSHPQIEHIQGATNQEATPDPPPALMILSRRLGLGQFEEHILLLCAAMELDTRIAALCARPKTTRHALTPPLPSRLLCLTIQCGKRFLRNAPCVTGG